MTQYILTIKGYEGSASFEYDLNGVLKAFKLEISGLGIPQVRYLVSEAVMLTGLKTMAGTGLSGKGKLTEVRTEITFEQFYEKYNYKMKPKQAKSAWDKLSMEERILAFDYVWKYDRSLMMQPRAKMYPATYLNQRIWHD